MNTNNKTERSKEMHSLLERRVLAPGRGDVRLKRAAKGVYRVELDGETMGYVVREHATGWRVRRTLESPLEGPTYRSPREAARELLPHTESKKMDYQRASEALDELLDEITEAQQLLFPGMAPRSGEAARKEPATKKKKAPPRRSTWSRMALSVKPETGGTYSIVAERKDGLAVHRAWGVVFRPGRSAGSYDGPSVVFVKDMTAKEKKNHYGAARIPRNPGWVVTQINTGAAVQSGIPSKKAAREFAEGLTMLAPELGRARTVTDAAKALPVELLEYRRMAFEGGGVKAAERLLQKRERFSPRRR